MYNFIDTTEVSDGVILPSEALKINGEYIENQISGYRTLTVKGREALSPDVVTYTTGIRDGARIKNKRFPERIITVTYQINAATNEAFREAYNKLAAILNVEDAELIFDDEPDKFFIGTPCVIGEVEPGRNCVVGEFEIVCTDPFKYSVIEYEATTDLDQSSILLDYNGTYKAFPTLEADFYSEDEASEDGETVTPLTGSGDCGFVAFFTEDEKIVQLGNPDELDIQENAYAKSQTLVNAVFNKSSSWGTAAKSQWSQNAVSDRLENVSGKMGMAVAYPAEDSTPAMTSKTILTATSKADAPTFNYKVVAKTVKRTADMVRVKVSVTASLGRDSSYFGRGYGLRASIYFGQSPWNNLTLKKTTDYWKGKTAHTVSTEFDVDVSRSQTKITGIKFMVERTDDLGKAGILGNTSCYDFPISEYVDGSPETYFLYPVSYGTGDKWHGPTITRTIPADASGATGASNFTFTYRHTMYGDADFYDFPGNGGIAEGISQKYGYFAAVLSDSAGKEVASIRVSKTSSSSNKASLTFCVGGVQKKKSEVQLTRSSKYFGKSPSAASISKSGNKITFLCGSDTPFVYTDDSITDTEVAKITFVFAGYGSSHLAYNGIYWAKFVKDNCTTWKDIPNKFSANDVLIADCQDGKIYLNGKETPALGALGNDWEEFILTPGLNQIGFAYSEWVPTGYAPTFKVRYREVFL